MPSLVAMYARLSSTSMQRTVRPNAAGESLAVGSGGIACDASAVRVYGALARCIDTAKRQEIDRGAMAGYVLHIKAGAAKDDGARARGQAARVLEAPRGSAPSGS